MAHTALINCEAIRASFRQWRSELEPLDTQLRESLAALAAYQSHLDAWQQQLAGEREELSRARTQLDEERAAAAQRQPQSQSETAAELSAALEKVTALSAALLARTEELRTVHNDRTQAVNDLELARASEKELRAALSEHQQTIERERAQWAEQVRALQQQLEQRPVEASAARCAAPSEGSRQPSVQPPAASSSVTADDAAETAVLGSILEQFGKLRQQRAMERPALKKTR